MPEFDAGAAAAESGAALPAYERVRFLATRRSELVLMRWNPGVESAIHDHGGGRGYLWLVAGSLRERLYEGANAPVVVAERVHHAPALVRVLRESLHTMESVGAVPARSVHLYREVTREMRVYDPARERFVRVHEGTPANLPIEESTVEETDL